MKTPILNINQFKETIPLSDFYINSFSDHLHLNKKLISRPHKHNFYLCVLFTKGTGIHEIDFNSYKIEPGNAFFLSPGQTHFWKFDTQPEGFIFFHSQEFYELQFLEHKLSEFPFYYSFQNPPFLKLSAKKIEILSQLFDEIHTEYLELKSFKKLKIVSLVNLIYIEFSKNYTHNIELTKLFPSSYLNILEKLVILINENFKNEKLPKFYANRLNITTKHLNRVIKETTNKTTSELISERIVLEAKRLIVHSSESLSTISYNLEFSEYSYFSKFFKLKTGSTPMNFRKRYKEDEINTIQKKLK
ncbi:AraC family transcriptional regulator [Zunongwangia endophytica]|uniref:AraC family transcriptional regulator n=1 Tax=Zunongwangia endophytica TaxID=1808945 RepID=A0ABV8HE52_9FLAO|nr:helix-turn-helix transcriptional regulator [Zunongwangia endophytica]MDN3594358.1 helix-turn-helix transcriptional regulator [Zunongwangia endophytica]